MYFGMIAGDLVIMLAIFYPMYTFSTYLFNTKKSNYNWTLYDGHTYRLKLVKAINFCIIRDFIHTIYILVSLYVSLDFLAIYAIPVPLIIHATKLGYWCWWRSSYSLYASRKEPGLFT